MAKENIKLIANNKKAYHDYFVEETFEAGKRDIYWDDVPFFVHPEHYRLGVRAMAAGDVTEIDSLEELKEYEQNNKGQN